MHVSGRLACFACLIGLALVGRAASAAGPLDPALAQVIDYARTHSIHGNRPDWPRVTAEAQAIAEASPGAGEAARTAAIRHVLAALDDGHSFYQPPSEPAKHAGVDRSREPVPGNVRKPIAQARTGDRQISALAIHAWSGTGAAVDAAAARVRTALREALDAADCGLLLDVTANSGGNMWPMMGGIAPLYDDVPLLVFETRDGRRQVVDVQGGRLRMQGRPYPQVALEALPRKPRHIALLLGPDTASSGEILALGFSGQASVRTFGRATAGATTANRTFRLSNGGTLALATAWIERRDGTRQLGPLRPDQETSQATAAAMHWLREQCR